MDRTSKLADLTLVSKYYPMANFSYPRNETIIPNGGPTMTDRRSVGSDTSAPGLTDDRTDSEVSADDDYQQHIPGVESEIWDSFWGRGGVGKKEEIELNPKAQYPALIPSPQRRRDQRARGEAGRRNHAWPLPEGTPLQHRNRQPAATYSPFPKPIALPPRRVMSPSWESSRPRSTKSPEQPRRPPRPDERLLTPCIHQQESPIKSVFTIKSESNLRNAAISGPVSPCEIRAASPAESVRPKTALEDRPPTPFEVEFPMTLHASVARSAAHLPLPEAPRQYTSMLNIKTSHYRPIPTPEPSPELHSVFEDDSDSEEEERHRSFFRFHRRSGSDIRRSARSESEAPSRRRRTKSKSGNSTAGKDPEDSSARPPSPDKEKPPRRKRGLSRILGRRSR